MCSLLSSNGAVLLSAMSLVCLHDNVQLGRCPTCLQRVCLACSLERGSCAGCGFRRQPASGQRSAEMTALSSYAQPLYPVPAVVAQPVMPDWMSFSPESTAPAGLQPELGREQTHLDVADSPLPRVPAPSAPPADADPYPAAVQDELSCPHGCGRFPTADDCRRHVTLLHTDTEEILRRAAQLVADERSRKRESPLATQSSSDHGVPPGCVLHTVSPLDTLAGIALRYRVTMEAVRRANRLPTEEVVGHRTLIIPTSYVPPPPSAEETTAQLAALADQQARQRSKLHKLFCELGRCTSDEARFYLENNDWAFDRAMAQRRGDLAWDVEQKVRRATQRA